MLIKEEELNRDIIDNNDLIGIEVEFFGNKVVRIIKNNYNDVLGIVPFSVYEDIVDEFETEVYEDIDDEYKSDIIGDILEGLFGKENRVKEEAKEYVDMINELVKKTEVKVKIAKLELMREQADELGVSTKGFLKKVDKKIERLRDE